MAAADNEVGEERRLNQKDESGEKIKCLRRCERRGKREQKVNEQWRVIPASSVIKTRGLCVCF